MSKTLGRYIYDTLAAESDVYSKVGGNLNPRISPYLRNAPTASDFPAIVFDVGSTQIATDSLAINRTCQTTATVSILDRTYDNADAVAKSVLDALDGNTSTADCITQIRIESVEHSMETPYDGSQDLVYRVNLSFSIIHKAPI